MGSDRPTYTKKRITNKYVNIPDVVLNFNRKGDNDLICATRPKETKLKSCKLT